MFLNIINTEYDWQYRTERSARAGKIMKEGSTIWPRGKMLGGCSAINAMLYLRGFPKDYDHWEKLGNAGWGYKSVLPYFLKSENNLDAEISLDTTHHSTKGPLKVGNYFTNDYPLPKIVIKAATEKGFKELRDFNANETIGYGYVQGTIADGQRVNVARAFLGSGPHRPNLHLIKHAHVTQLQFDSHGNVTGVVFRYKNTTLTALATKEVILSAGATNTPQILMLSGVGPKEHLATLEIPVRKDLPVGKNLQDHIYVAMFYRINKTGEVNVEDPNFAAYEYLTKRKGPLATPLVNIVGFVDTANSTDPYPDIEFVYNFFPQGSLSTLKPFLELASYSPDAIKILIDAVKESHILVSWCMISRPKSRGMIQLRSADPFDKVKIYPHYFSEADDIETVTRGIKFSNSFLNTQSFKDNEISLIRFDVPECDILVYKSDDYWHCYASYFSSTLYHVSGTAKMGPDSDPEAVVDSQLQVRGVRNLRVVDASIMPNIVSVNTNAAAIMIGEKGADFIKSKWNNVDSLHV